MPSLADLAVSVSPRADPYGYPGAAVDADYLWLDSWMYGIAPAPGLELAQWTVTVDGGPLAAIGAGPDACLADARLDTALAVVGAGPISTRHPVVSFGSNSAPAQLRDKFAALDTANKAVPVMRGSIAGLSLGYSPHVSVFGYLPYVLVNSDDRPPLPVFVQFFDARQLAAINQTEPNYQLVAVPADGYPLTLGSGETIAAYGAYKGKWGALRSAGRRGPVVAGSQQEVFGRLNKASWFRSLAGPGDVRTQMSRFRDDAGLREKVRVELSARGLTTGDGWLAVGR